MLGEVLGAKEGRDVSSRGCRPDAKDDDTCAIVNERERLGS